MNPKPRSETIFLMVPVGIFDSLSRTEGDSSRACSRKSEPAVSAGDCRPVHYTGELTLLPDRLRPRLALLGNTTDRQAFPPANLSVTGLAAPSEGSATVVHTRSPELRLLFAVPGLPPSAAGEVGPHRTQTRSERRGSWRTTGRSQEGGDPRTLGTTPRRSADSAR